MGDDSCSPKIRVEGESISRLARSLEIAIAAQQDSVKRFDRIAGATLAKHLNTISFTAFASKMNDVIESASLAGSAASMQKLVAQNTAITDTLVRTAGLNWAAQAQKQAVSLASAGAKALTLNSRMAENALRAAGLSRPIAERLTPVFENRMTTLIERFAREFDDLSRRIREQAERDVKFSQLMIDLGWPPPIDLPSSTVARILKLAEDPGQLESKATIEGVLTDHFDTRRLRAKAKSWAAHKLLQRRHTILSKAIEAHIKGDYELSIPALVSQIEGVIADGFGHVGQMGGAQYQKYLDTHFDENGNNDAEDAANRAIRQFVAKILLAQFEHGKPSGSPLSRHAILHGGDTDFPCQENSLRAILLLDALQDSFGFASLGGSEVYHRQGCPSVLSSKSPVRHQRDSAELVHAGRRPCKRCKPE